MILDDEIMVPPNLACAARPTDRLAARWTSSKPAPRASDSRSPRACSAALSPGSRATIKCFAGPLLLVVGLAAAYAWGESLSAEDHPAWPGWFLGAAAAVFAFVVVADVVEGAVTRAGEQGSVASLGAIGAVLVLAIAGISLTFLAPVSIAVLLVLLWVAVGRRRRAGRKHEGLRTLRR